MGWESYRRRYRLRHDVLDDVAKVGPVLAVARWWSRIAAEYGDVAGLLADVRVHWDRAALARADAADELGDSPAAARSALAAEQRPALDLLAAYADCRPSGPVPAAAFAC